MRERDRCIGGGGQYLCRGKDIHMWQYNYTDELYHYGRKGMKWGEHIYGSPKKYQKALNSMDKESTKHIGKYMQYDTKSNKIKTKAKTYSKKHPNTTSRGMKKLNKYADKYAGLASKRDAELAKSKEIDSNSWKTMASAVEKGYSIKVSEVYRNADKGRQFVAALLGGPYAVVGYSTAQAARYGKRYPYTNKKGKTIYQNPGLVQGNKYKVKKVK